jgi:hypothetical protein
MAAGILPVPGTEYGPCDTDCKHEDCAVTREMAVSLCTICEKVIGYGNRFYAETRHPLRLQHADCLEATYDKETQDDIKNS